MEKGDLAGALALLDGAIRPDTRNVALWMQRAEVRLKAGALEDALADCNRGLELAVPKGGVTVLVGEEEGMRSAIGAVVRLRGTVLGSLADWRGMAKDYADATTLMPKDAHTWRGRAAAEESLGHLDDALASLGTAIDLHDAGEALDLVKRAQVYQLLGRNAEARRDLERAAVLAAGKPALVDVELERVALATSLGDLPAARAACDRVSAADPAFAGWAALLRWSNAGQGERESATRRLREDFSGKPGTDPLVVELVRLCADGVGDTDGFALAGRESGARCPMWYFGACRSAQLGRDAEARLRLLRCVNTGRPEYVQWRMALARLRAAAGTQPVRPSLGVTVAAVADAQTPTLVVADLPADGAAAIQGLQRGDRILRVNAGPATVAAFDALTKAVYFGTPVRFGIARGDKTTALFVLAGIAAP